MQGMTRVRELSSPIIGIVVLGEGRGEEEGCSGGYTSATRAQSGSGDIQSTKPFHALMEARRAVSTVPPRTTSFCGVAGDDEHAKIATPKWVARLTRVSVMALELTPNGESILERPCIVVVVDGGKRKEAE